jgi:hypothetical protein
VDPQRAVREPAGRRRRQLDDALERTVHRLDVAEAPLGGERFERRGLDEGRVARRGLDRVGERALGCDAIAPPRERTSEQGVQPREASTVGRPEGLLGDLHRAVEASTGLGRIGRASEPREEQMRLGGDGWVGRLGGALAVRPSRLGRAEPLRDLAPAEQRRGIGGELRRRSERSLGLDQAPGASELAGRYALEIDDPAADAWIRSLVSPELSDGRCRVEQAQDGRVIVGVRAPHRRVGHEREGLGELPRRGAQQRLLEQQGDHLRRSDRDALARQRQRRLEVGGVSPHELTEQREARPVEEVCVQAGASHLRPHPVFEGVHELAEAPRVLARRGLEEVGEEVRVEREPRARLAHGLDHPVEGLVPKVEGDDREGGRVEASDDLVGDLRRRTLAGLLGLLATRDGRVDERARGARGLLHLAGREERPPHRGALLVADPHDRGTRERLPAKGLDPRQLGLKARALVGRRVSREHPEQDGDGADVSAGREGLCGALDRPPAPPLEEAPLLIGGREQEKGPEDRARAPAPIPSLEAVVGVLELLCDHAQEPPFVVVPLRAREERVPERGGELAVGDRGRAQPPRHRRRILWPSGVAPARADERDEDREETGGSRQAQHGVSADASSGGGC